MKRRKENLTTLLLIVVILLSGCSGCGQRKKETAQCEHLPDDVLHPDHDHHSTAYMKVPKAPEGDTCFKTIQFPKTPPKLNNGHYRLPKAPYALPDFVEKYPDHFTVDDRRFWEVAHPPEKARRLEAYQVGLKDDRRICATDNRDCGGRIRHAHHNRIPLENVGFEEKSEGTV